MTNRLPISRHRRRTSSGVQWVEFAFVILPLFAIISGFFDVTFSIFNWTTLQNAARQGCRYAVTFSTSGALGQDASIAQTVTNFSMGLLSASTPVDSTTSGALSITTNYYTQQNPNTPVAGAAGNVPGNIVEVSVVNFPLQWVVPISGTFGLLGGDEPGSAFRPQAPTTISVYARDILGGYPVGLTTVTR